MPPVFGKGVEELLTIGRSMEEIRAGQERTTQKRLIDFSCLGINVKETIFGKE